MPHCGGGCAKYLHPTAPVIIREVQEVDCVRTVKDGRASYSLLNSTHPVRVQVCPACAERLDAKAKQAGASR